MSCKPIDTDFTGAHCFRKPGHPDALNALDALTADAHRMRYRLQRNSIRHSDRLVRESGAAPEQKGRDRMPLIRPLWRIPGIALRERRYPAGRERVPEPMVMNAPESVDAFHLGGATNPGMQAIYDFGARAIDRLIPPHGRLLDLGVGSGRAISAILRRRPDISVTAVDLAPNMLAKARDLFVAEGLNSRVELVEADITALPGRILDHEWQGVSCMWTLHQLPDGSTLEAAVRQIAAVRAKNAAAVWITDFARLRNPSTTADMLDCVDPGSPAILRDDAIASEAAAFTPAELLSAFELAGLADLQRGHPRPVPYLQAYWTHGPRHDGAGPKTEGARLRGRAARDAATLRWGFSAKPF
ncbi:class I SAM-dependent methyltransferase [Mycobacterium deserti]|uniref:Class I SAM-dependent methyltransferase n=1 Tax=Mycobacterium deserti TaxID=2978347 RepID=A0ABT2M9W1_9MYCO|nr:class I SAM-dependent methyltransferase [Mycobacterium deserti]MCT7659058.1 class I SAM-dependent methyltransferase [Mycobacterium deserti]